MTAHDELKYVIDLIQSHFEFELTDSDTLFFYNGESFTVCLLNSPPEEFFVVEYEDGEDGCAFYPADYSNLDDLVSDMINEIERCIPGTH